VISTFKLFQNQRTTNSETGKKLQNQRSTNLSHTQNLKKPAFFHGTPGKEFNELVILWLGT
jgi:hypothetical protein